ncbi:Probable chitinase 2 [Gryllus bimaculatus]|nr:Probable chitinase 2 [Gryllus bimaculatus]
MQMKKMFSTNIVVMLFAIYIKGVEPSQVVGCYFGSWAGYRTGNGCFQPENINASLCTHMFYSFVGITSNGGIRILDEWNDLPSGKDFFGRFNMLKTTHPNVKTLVAVGGWNEGSVTFSKVANDANLRSAFAKNAANFVLQYGFDGFDIDWEYPASRGGAASDYEAYALMLKELRSVFDHHGLLLTAAVHSGPSYIDTSYNVKEISHTAGHNAPLYKSSADITAADLVLNVDASIQHWLQNGAVAEKLVLGVGTYGHSFTLSDSSNTAIGAPVSGPGIAGPYTQESGSLGYNEVCLNINAGWNVVWDDNILAPYAYSGNQWVGFDNVESAKIKAEYARDLGLAGVFIWSLETDDFTGSCGDGKFPILTALNAVVRTSDGNNEATTPSVGSTDSTATATTTIGSGTSPQSSSTTSPPTQLCSSVGYVRDPNDCQIFYYCQPNGLNGFTNHKFQCFGDLVYDVTLNLCNYKDQVPECN